MRESPNTRRKRLRSLGAQESLQSDTIPVAIIESIYRGTRAETAGTVTTSTLWDEVSQEIHTHCQRNPGHWPLFVAMLDHVASPPSARYTVWDTLGCPIDRGGASIDGIATATPSTPSTPRITIGRRWRLRPGDIIVFSAESQCAPVTLANHADWSVAADTPLSLVRVSSPKRLATGDSLRASLMYNLVLKEHVSPHLPLYCGAFYTRNPLPAALRADAAVSGDKGCGFMLHEALDVRLCGNYNILKVMPYTDPTLAVLSFSLQLLYAMASMQVAVSGVSIGFKHLTPHHLGFSRLASRTPERRVPIYTVVPHNGPPVSFTPYPTPGHASVSKPFDVATLGLASSPQYLLTLTTDDVHGHVAHAHSHSQYADVDSLLTLPPENLFFKHAPEHLTGTILHGNTWSAAMLILMVAGSAYARDPTRILHRAGAVHADSERAGALAEEQGWIMHPPTDFIDACTADAQLTISESYYVWNLVEMLGFPPASDQVTRNDYVHTSLYNVITTYSGHFTYARTTRGWLFPTVHGAAAPASDDFMYREWLTDVNPRLRQYADHLRQALGIMLVSVERMLSWCGQSRNRPLNQLLVDAKNISRGVGSHQYADKFYIPLSAMSTLSRAHVLYCRTYPISPHLLTRAGHFRENKMHEPYAHQTEWTLDTKALKSTQRRAGKKRFRTLYFPITGAVHNATLPGTSAVPYYHWQDDVHAQDAPSPKLVSEAHKYYAHLDARLGPVANTRARSARKVIEPPLRCTQCSNAAQLAVSPLPFCSGTCYNRYITDPNTNTVPSNPPPLVSLSKPRALADT